MVVSTPVVCAAAERAAESAAQQHVLHAKVSGSLVGC